MLPKRKRGDDKVKSSTKRQKVSGDKGGSKTKRPPVFCKNVHCKGLGGNRRHMQGGLQGYCRQCAPMFLSAQAFSEAKEKRARREKNG